MSDWRPKTELGRARYAYSCHKSYTRKRIDRQGNPTLFLLTFDEWYNIWLESGHYNNRGVKKGQYCMCRYSDIGNYEVGNVYIQQVGDNIKQAMSSRVVSEETKQKIRAARLGTKRSPETCAKLSVALTGNNNKKGKYKNGKEYIS